MDGKVVASSVFLLLLAGMVAADANNLCPLNPTPAYMDIILEPPAGPGSIVTTYVYNISKDDYVKNGIAGALIIVVNQTNISDPNLCYEVTDSGGWANFTYNSNLDGCTDYWFIFCPQPDALTNLAARQTCLNGTHLPQYMINNPITTACNHGGSPLIGTSNYLLAHNQFYVCTQQPKTYSGLCWPLMLIFGLLLGANFLLGKNPFGSFDFSAIRMNRGRQYTMRAQQRSTDITSIVMGVMSASETVTGGNGLQTALRKAAVSLGNSIGGGDGGKGEDKTTGTKQTEPPPKNNPPADPNAPKSTFLENKEPKPIGWLDQDKGEKRVNNTQTTPLVVNKGWRGEFNPITNPLGEISRASAPGSTTTRQTTWVVTTPNKGATPDINAFRNYGERLAQNAIVAGQKSTLTQGTQGTPMSNTLQVMMSTPSIVGLLYTLFSADYWKSWKESAMPQGMTSWSAGGAANMLWEIIKRKLMTIANFGSKSDKDGQSFWSALGERALTATKAVFASYELLNTASRMVKNTQMGWKGIGGKSKRNSEIGGIGFIDSFNKINLGLFGRNLGETIQMINEPSSVYLLSFFAPIIDAGRDKLSMMMSITPESMSLAGKEVIVDNASYTITARLSVYDAAGNEVTGKARDAILIAKGITGSWEEAMKQFESMGGKAKYLEIGTNTKAAEISGFTFDRNVAKQLDYEEARKKVIMHQLEYLSTRGSKDDQEMMNRFMQIVSDSKEFGGVDAVRDCKSYVDAMQTLLKYINGEGNAGELAKNQVIWSILKIHSDNPDATKAAEENENAAKIMLKDKNSLANALVDNRAFQKMLGVTWLEPEGHTGDEKARLEAIKKNRMEELHALIIEGDALHIANRMASTTNESSLMQNAQMRNIVQDELQTVDRLSSMLSAMMRGGVGTAPEFAMLSQTQEAYLALAEADAKQRNLKFDILSNMNGEPMSYFNALFGADRVAIQEQHEYVKNQIEQKRKELESVTPDKKNELMIDLGRLEQAETIINTFITAKAPVANEDLNAANKKMFDYFLAYHQDLSQSSNAIYELWSNGGSGLNSLINASKNEWIGRILSTGGNINDVTSALTIKSGYYSLNTLPQINLGLVTQSLGDSQEDKKALQNAGLYVEAQDMRTRNLSMALDEINQKLAQGNMDLDRGESVSRFKVQTKAQQAVFLELNFALRDAYLTGPAASYGAVIKELAQMNLNEDALTKINLSGMKAVRLDEYAALGPAAMKDKVLDLTKVDYADVNQVREANTLVNVHYLDRQIELSELHKNDYAGSYLQWNDLRVNMENLRSWVLKANQEIAEKSKDYGDLSKEYAQFKANYEKMNSENVGDLAQLGTLTQIQANQLEYFNSVKKYLKDADEYMNKANYMMDKFEQQIQKNMWHIREDEQRMNSTSGTYVQHQLLERANEMMGSSYMNNPMGSILNQVRGGGYYNVENDLLSLVVGINATPLMTESLGAYERSMISDSKGMLSLIPESILPDKPIPESQTAKIIIGSIPGGAPTYGALYGLGQLGQDTKMTTSGEGLHSLDLSTPIWDLQRPVRPVMPETPKEIPVEKKEQVVHYEMFQTLGNVSSTFTYVPGLSGDMLSPERKARWGYAGQQVLTQAKQEKLSSESMAFLTSNNLATDEQVEVFKSKQLTWNGESKSYGLVRGVEGGLNDAQIAAWILHNDTRTIRGGVFAKSEFKTALKGIAGETPQERAEALMQYAIDNSSQLVKDQDVHYKYEYKGETKTARMGKKDYEIVGQRVDRVTEMYKNWKGGQ